MIHFILFKYQYVILCNDFRLVNFFKAHLFILFYCFYPRFCYNVASYFWTLASKTKQNKKACWVLELNSLLSESRQEVEDITVCAYRLFMMVFFSSRRKNTPMLFMGEQEMVRLEVNYWKKVSTPSHTSWKNNLEHGHFISLGLDLLLAREPEARSSC